MVGIGIIECRFVKPRFRKQLLQFRFCKCPDARRIRVPRNAVEVAPRMVLRTARKVFQPKPVRNGYEKHTVFRKMHADELQQILIGPVRLNELRSALQGACQRDHVIIRRQALLRIPEAAHADFYIVPAPVPVGIDKTLRP